MITAKEARDRMSGAERDELARWLNFLDKEISRAAIANCGTYIICVPKDLVLSLIAELSRNGFGVKVNGENELEISWT